MNNAIHNSIVSFIWGIGDDVLRDVYVRGKYRDVILPMTVIRRLDALLEPGKEKTLAMKKHLDAARIANQHAALCQAAGEAFYNISPFTLRDLKNRAKQQLFPEKPRKAPFSAFLALLHHFHTELVGKTVPEGFYEDHFAASGAQGQCKCCLS